MYLTEIFKRKSDSEKISALLKKAKQLVIEFGSKKNLQHTNQGWKDANEIHHSCVKRLTQLTIQHDQNQLEVKTLIEFIDELKQLIRVGPQ